MENADFSARYDGYLRAIEDCLNGLFTQECAWNDLYEAMRYSLLSGGKRLRPVLTLEFARLSGADFRAALPAACALELVHTYSLIHDDLPCMDDDDLRRGKPTNHKVYGETLAVLAGDALQPEAFRLILTAPDLTDAQRADCARILAEAAGADASGADGMVAGQVLDTLHTAQTQDELTRVHRLKTGAMIAGACMLGVAAGGGGDDLRAAAREYGYQLGLAFQIRDDMLDVIGSAEEFGKPIGSDREEGKRTYVDLLGLEACDALVHTLSDRAAAAVAPYDRDDFLKELAERLKERKK